MGEAEVFHIEFFPEHTSCGSNLHSLLIHLVGLPTDQNPQTYLVWHFALWPWFCLVLIAS